MLSRLGRRHITQRTRAVRFGPLARVPGGEQGIPSARSVFDFPSCSESDGSEEDAAWGGSWYGHWTRELELERAQRTGHAKPGGSSFRCPVCVSGAGSYRGFPSLAALLQHANDVTRVEARKKAHEGYARAIAESQKTLISADREETASREFRVEIADPGSIVKPPIVVAQSLRPGHNRGRDHERSIGLENVLGESLQAKGYPVRRVKAVWDPRGYRQTALVFFDENESGLLSAQHLAARQEQRGAGRAAWERACAVRACALEANECARVFC
ncbi:hypothetical protein KFL_002920135 [Klebsormidium nitens]|uniref:XS domain-containing protein n=1 Tax=Klebsormidium nitens TaxID=105231 RepID=A0A1Y1ICP1_KLENI|nr:hypothetical protein KFL_002920135 [Klebsormidium nitens]|eukprot:GAQ86497.1 hypothetical protein KFL_002920135 [Klebsormidium nitens]